jgi:hypothetical protein
MPSLSSVQRAVPYPRGTRCSRSVSCALGVPEVVVSVETAVPRVPVVPRRRALRALMSRGRPPGVRCQRPALRAGTREEDPTGFSPFSPEEDPMGWDVSPRCFWPPLSPLPTSRGLELPGRRSARACYPRFASGQESRRSDGPGVSKRELGRGCAEASRRGGEASGDGGRAREPVEAVNLQHPTFHEEQASGVGYCM